MLLDEWLEGCNAYRYCQNQSLDVHVELAVPQPMLSVGSKPELISSSCLMVGSWQPSCSLP